MSAWSFRQSCETFGAMIRLTLPVDALGEKKNFFFCSLRPDFESGSLHPSSEFLNRDELLPSSWFLNRDVCSLRPDFWIGTFAPFVPIFESGRVAPFVPIFESGHFGEFWDFQNGRRTCCTVCTWLKLASSPPPAYLLHSRGDSSPHSSPAAEFGNCLCCQLSAALLLIKLGSVGCRSFPSCLSCLSQLPQERWIFFHNRRLLQSCSILEEDPGSEYYQDWVLAAF